MSDAADVESGAVTEQPPFGVPELLSAVAGSGRVLDLGCGSGRLTVALARAGAAVTGIDTSRERLEQARRRAGEAGVELQLVEADLDEPLPFEDGSFDAATSRLALMVAAAPAATLRELRRVVVPDGRIATVLWASLDQNPWFSAPREAIAAVLGGERGSLRGASGSSAIPPKRQTCTAPPACATSRRRCSGSTFPLRTRRSTGSGSRRRTLISAASRKR